MVNLEELGAGAFGQVSRAYDKTMKSLVVLKYMSKVNSNNEDTLDGIRYEMAIMKRINKLKNPNFLRFYGIFKTKDQYILEIESGEIDLKQILDFRSNYQIEEATYILNSLAHDYKILEDHGIAHCDVKPDNVILVRNGDVFKYKISDFGISLFTGKGVKTVFCEECWGWTPSYSAPEVRNIKTLNFNKKEDQEKMYDPYKGDCYSLALSILKLIGKSFTDLVQDSKNMSNLKPFEILLIKMLSKTPENRPSFAEIEEETKKMPSKIPVNEEQNIKDFRKYFEGKKVLNYLVGVFYKYLEMRMEKEADLYLQTLLAFDVKGYSNYTFHQEDAQNNLNFAKADFSFFLKKDFPSAMEVYTSTLKKTTFEFYQFPYIATAYVRKMILNTEKFKTEKNPLILEELEDDYYELSSMRFQNSNRDTIIMEHGLTEDGLNNMGIFACVLKKFDESMNFFSKIEKNEKDTHIDKLDQFKLEKFEEKKKKIMGEGNLKQETKIKDNNKSLNFYNNFAIVAFLSGNLEKCKSLISECESQMTISIWKNRQNEYYLKTYEENKKIFSEQPNFENQILRFDFIYKLGICGWSRIEQSDPWTAHMLNYGNVKKRRKINEKVFDEDNE